MWMLVLQGWRNLRRNLRRSILTTAMVAVGLTLLIFTYALLQGFVPQMIEGGARTLNGHILIQGDGYLRNKQFQTMVEQPKAVEDVLRKDPRIEAWSARLLARGILGSAESVRGIKLLGVDFEQDKKIIHLYRKIQKGQTPKASDPKIRASRRVVEMMIGYKLARKLKLEVGNKAVLRVGQWGGGATSVATRIVGIFKTGSPGFDGLTAVVTRQDAARFLKTGARVHQFAIRVKDVHKTQAVAAALQAKLKGSSKPVEVLPWDKFAPEIQAMVEMMKMSIGIMLLFIFPVVLLGCLNTMSMSVFERTREIGVLKALGTKPRQILTIVCAEAVWIGVIGTTLGLILGGGLSFYFEATGGLSLRPFMSEDVKMLVSGVALDPVMWVQTTINGFVIPILVVMLSTIVAALIPAWKASKLPPVEAMRHV